MTIEPNAETDLAVAKAVGIGIDMGVDVCFRVGLWPQRTWLPTRDMNHAMEAAERFTNGLIKVQRLPQIWEAQLGDSLGRANTPELAICEAILAMKEKNQ